jgi:hypothetical protein
MLNVYCIPGMGVDGRLFRNLKIDDSRLYHIKWLTPCRNESLQEYALRLSEQIDSSQPFILIGVSFGGMCSVEIAKHLNPVRTFLISSCKKSNELPLKISFWKKFSLYKKLSDAFYIKGAMLVKRQFGVVTKEQSEKFHEMLKTAPDNYFSGAVHCIMNWKNEIIPEGLIHIHGTADRVLPHNKMICDYKLDGGDHFMIVSRAEEINEIINRELKECRSDLIS